RSHRDHGCWPGVGRGAAWRNPATRRCRGVARADDGGCLHRCGRAVTAKWIRSRGCRVSRRSDKLRLVRALLVTEALQVVRDPSTIELGLVLSIILIVLFMSGLSLDMKDVPVAIVVEDSSPSATELIARFHLSPYFHAQITHSMPPAERLMLQR